MTPKNTQLSVDGIISLLVGRVKNPDYTTSVAADKASAELITLINEAVDNRVAELAGMRVIELQEELRRVYNRVAKRKSRLKTLKEKKV